MFGGDDVDDRTRGGQDGVAGAEPDQVFAHSHFSVAKREIRVEINLSAKIADSASAGHGNWESF